MPLGPAAVVKLITSLFSKYYSDLEPVSQAWDR